MSDYYPPLSVLVKWREGGMTPEQVHESRILMANTKWTVCPKCNKKVHNRWLNRHIKSDCKIGAMSDDFIPYYVKKKVPRIPDRVINHWRNKWGWTDKQIAEACQRFSNSWKEIK